MKEKFKLYIKGIITGTLITSVLYAVPAFSDGIEVFFNTVNIRVNGLEVAEIGKDYSKNSRTDIPYSINYNGNVYLPMRRMGEIFDKDIYWDDDTKTVSAMDEYDTRKTIKFENGATIISKPDKNGVKWLYQIFADSNDKYYLSIKKEDSSSIFFYRIAHSGNGTPAIRVTDDALYFIRIDDQRDFEAAFGYGAYVKLSFQNYSDNFSLEVLEELITIDEDNVVFDGNYLYFAGNTLSNLTCGALTAFNIETLEYESHFNVLHWTFIRDLALESSDENTAVLTFRHESVPNEPTCRIPFDKTAKNFGKMEIVTEE